jgi:hypothetical protein
MIAPFLDQFIETASRNFARSRHSFGSSSLHLFRNLNRQAKLFLELEYEVG